MNKLCIHIATRDRPTELALLLQSLRTQTYQNFDIIIVDDQSGTPLFSYHFMNCLLARMRLEGHTVFTVRTEFPHGVSKARQRCIDETIKKGYDYFLRLDDDVILEEDYIERLFNVLNKGYDLATGATVPMVGPTFKRETRFLKGIVNRVILDDEGKYIMNGDDCGMAYTDEGIFPAHHFRSCALYYTKIHTEWSVHYTPTRLSKHGFREEQIFSYKILLAGGKIGCDVKAINYHQMTPSGGERFSDSNELIMHNQKVLEDYTKDNKDALNKIFTRENMPSELELKKENNTARR